MFQNFMDFFSIFEPIDLIWTTLYTLGNTNTYTY